MLRKTLLVTISFVCMGTSSCYAKRPEKLPHEMCTLSVTDSEAYCVKSGTSAPKLEEKPIDYMHKSTCRTPENEAINQVNIHNLEAYADYLERQIKILLERPRRS